MMSLDGAFMTFLDSACDPFGDRERALDMDAIAAMEERSRSLSERTQVLRAFWTAYSVSRCLRTGEHDAVAGAALVYADHERVPDCLDSGEVIEQFKALRDRMRAARLKDYQNSGIDSLVSKTLWCCYPHSAPIYDRNASTALRILGRLCGFPSYLSSSPYEDFVRAWFEGYKIVASIIPERSNYPYKIRTFDAFLWWLGQGDFERTTRDP